ncbi:hypothetical protein EMB92_07535 [Bifidobacterium callitrichos]|uniref:CopG family transcriptional regulator n=2 Tax=Bifidobacterium callitrichos TaxID=762209 RepID=A0A5M9ZB52_9BIFI|nr:hypothetical protein [Bifidobacterium callitrichos]KAA8815803.1 hypothetical protein EMB92_07535 [Bifidobacterium callitrichos]
MAIDYDPKVRLVEMIAFDAGNGSMIMYHANNAQKKFLRELGLSERDIRRLIGGDDIMDPITTADGTVVTEKMLDQWPADVEHGVYHGSPGKVVTRRRFGRPRTYAEPMDTVTLRVTADTLHEAEQLANHDNVSRATMLRELLDLGLKEKRRRMTA